MSERTWGFNSPLAHSYSPGTMFPRMVRPASGTADDKGMRRTSVALLALTAGLTASAALRRFVANRRTVATRAATASATPLADSAAEALPADAVVLPFARRVATQPAAAPRDTAQPAAGQPAAAVRCGDSGGRTKAGAPCAARATSAGRCHHHRVAA